MKIIRYIKRRGFTDRLYFANLFCAWVYTLLCLVFSTLGKYLEIEDYSFVSIVCPLIWGELSVHTAFIIHKSKVENLNKHVPLDRAEWNGNVNIDV